MLKSWRSAIVVCVAAAVCACGPSQPTASTNSGGDSAKVAAAPATPTERRIADLVAINSALAAYKAKYGGYPIQYSGLEGASTKGATWIDGLAPEFLRALPTDPETAGPEGPEYRYASSGTGYKLIAHGVSGACGPEVEKDGVRVDVARTNSNGCWAYGFWTPDMERL